MGTAEIVAYVVELWPDANFTDTELRLLGKAVGGVPEDQARVALEAIRLERSSRKPAPSWIYDAMQRIRRQGEGQAFAGGRAIDFKNWKFTDTLRAGWAKAGYAQAASMTDEQLIRRYWYIEKARALEVYGEGQGPHMLAARLSECRTDLIVIGFPHNEAQYEAEKLVGVAVDVIDP